MTTNLLISYPAIPWAATARASNRAWSQDWPLNNIISGERYLYGQTENALNFNVEFDLGVGKTAAVDHFIAARTDRLKSNSVNQITIDSGSAGIGGAYTTQATLNIAAATLTGTRQHDYIYSSLNLSAARSWRLSVSSTLISAASFPVCKFYFGSAFDMGRNPDYKFQRLPAKQANFVSDSGNNYLARTADAIYKFNFTWTGVSDAKATEFMNTIKTGSDVYNHRFFLFTKGAHEILDNQGVVHVKLNSAVVTKEKKAANWNIIEAEFQEVLG